MVLARFLTRLAGLWFLFGAMMKLFFGTPADLPLIGPELSLDTATVLFKIVIAVEVLVGVMAFLRPPAGWMPSAMLLSVFVVITALQVVKGEESCGCFGTAVNVTPELMLAVDGALLALLLLSRPWRMEPGRLDLPWIVIATAALVGFVLAVVIDRRAPETGDCVKPPPGAMVDFDLTTWKGKVLADTTLCPWLTKDQRATTGVIVIWRESCEVCAQHLIELSYEDTEMVLLELPKEEDQKKAVETLPEGSHVQRIDLPAGYDWWLTPPVHIEVTNGTVDVAIQGMDVLDHMEKKKLPKRQPRR